MINVDFSQFYSQFHFVRPWWLLAFILLFLVLYIIKKYSVFQSPWHKLLPKHLSSVLLEQSEPSETSHSRVNSQQIKTLILGFCIIIALAGPAWQKIPQPVFQLERGSVLVMDMSYSMYSTDIKPNRLTRARYKALDLLSLINEGDIGLIAYAGDAFTISPLTQDIKNIELLMPSLSPDIMPALGANALAALTLASESLNNAGHISGDIYWFTDDIDNEEIADIYAWSKQNSHKLHILGIGTAQGAPIKLTSGELLKDNLGAIVVPKLPEAKLAGLAKRGRGEYSTIRHDDSDLKRLTQHLVNASDEKVAKKQENQQELQQGDQYHEAGPWLLFIALPILLSYFRRGAIAASMAYLTPLMLSFAMMSAKPAFAEQQSLTTNNTANNQEVASNNTAQSGVKQFWQNLWNTKDQQGQKQFDQGNYSDAANNFEHSQWQGSAYYKAGNYQKALDAFKQSNTGDALYNQGNAHAQMQQFDQAIDAYKRALEKDPSLTDAKENLEKIEALKEQQQQQNQQQGDEQNQQQGEQQNQQQGEQQNQQQGEQQNQPQGDEQSKQQGEQQNQQQGEQQNQKQGEQQNQQQDDEQNQQQGEQQNQQQAEQQNQQQGKQDKESQAAQAQEGKDTDEKSLAQQASEQKAQEVQQKHQQMLNKVTDDPYLLLRNKMQLEYQKRKQEGHQQGVNKKW